MTLSHWYEKRADVYRMSREPDGAGGFVTSRSLVREGLPVKVDLPKSTEEHRAGQKFRAEITHNVFTDPHEDVQRGDELEVDGSLLRVWAVVFPSTALYAKIRCEEAQVEPDGGGES